MALLPSVSTGLHQQPSKRNEQQCGEHVRDVPQAAATISDLFFLSSMHLSFLKMVSS